MTIAGPNAIQLQISGVLDQLPALCFCHLAVQSRWEHTLVSCHLYPLSHQHLCAAPFLIISVPDHIL